MRRVAGPQDRHPGPVGDALDGTSDGVGAHASGDVAPPVNADKGGGVGAAPARFGLGGEPGAVGGPGPHRADLGVLGVADLGVAHRVRPLLSRRIRRAYPTRSRRVRDSRTPNRERGNGAPRSGKTRTRRRPGRKDVPRTEGGSPTRVPTEQAGGRVRSLLSTAEAPGQSVYRCVLFEHERNRRATESSARRTRLRVRSPRPAARDTSRVPREPGRRRRHHCGGDRPPHRPDSPPPPPRTGPH